MKKYSSFIYVMFSVLAVVVLLIGAADRIPAQPIGEDAPIKPKYPARYMGGDAKVITAPNGALIYDKALESVGRIVYIEPTVEKLADGVWITSIWYTPQMIYKARV
jgi:hypothetical protein